MRRLIVTCALSAFGTLALLSFLNVDHTYAQPKPKAAAKTSKAAAEPAYGNIDSISQEELQNYLYFIASDQLEGRNFPSRGYDTAALYVAGHLSEWGLKPGGSTAGTTGPLQPYLMPIELVARTVVPEESKLTVIGPPAGGRGRGGTGGEGSQTGGARGGNAEPQSTAFEYGREWTTGSGGFAGRGATVAGPLEVTANLVFAGNGYVINKTKTNPYEGIEVKGKIVVVAGLPPELEAQQGGRGGRAGRGGANPQTPGQQTPAAAEAATERPAGRGANTANPLGENCTDYFSPEAYAAKNGALAVVTVANFQQAAALGTPTGRGGRGPGLNGPNFQVKKFLDGGACPSAPAFTAGLAVTNALFQGEKMSGAQVFYAAGESRKVDSFELNARKKLSIKLAVKTEENHGENVVGIVEGSDPVLKNEYVIVSAHMDHIGLTAPGSDGDSINNGADDDGSGTVGVMALARAYAEGAAKGMRPKRSIVFLWNGGEEKGLLGSRYFTQFPPIDLTKVVADLNIDMIGRTKSDKSVDPNTTHVLVKPGEVLVIGPNISSDDLGQVIDSVNVHGQKMDFNHFYDTTAPDATHDNLGPQPNGQRIFYRSDHYNFAKVGIPIAFFTTGLHVDYHRPSDTPDKIDYQEMQRITKTVGAVAWQLANQAGRPKLKTNLPEQLVKDMKAAQAQGWGKVTPILTPLPGEPF